MCCGPLAYPPARPGVAAVGIGVPSQIVKSRPAPLFAQAQLEARVVLRMERNSEGDLEVVLRVVERRAWTGARAE
jgi:hypothetical protein